MLLLLIFAIAVFKGVIAYALGAGVALALWLIGLIIRLRINVLLRWGIGVVVAIVYSFSSLHPVSRETLSEAEYGYKIYEYWSEAICYGVAVVALALTGLLIGITRGMVTLGKGAANSKRID